MELPKILKDEIWDYCRVNNISNIDEFTLRLVTQGFTIEKFGATPTPKEKIVEKIVDKIIEVPVEKIVEKIVEVEKVVEKEVYISDDEEVKKLANEVSRLEKENKDQYIKLTGEIEKVTAKLDVTQKLLDDERSKGKRDLYGEK